MNTVSIMGRLLRDPELKQSSNGISVTRFTIAVDRKYQQQGSLRKADFIDCVAWRRTAEFITTYFVKGQMIAIEGELQTDTYTDKDDNKRKSTKVSVNHVSFCGDRRQAPASYDTMGHDEVGDIDDLPFILD